MLTNRTGGGGGGGEGAQPLLHCWYARRKCRTKALRKARVMGVKRVARCKCSDSNDCRSPKTS